MSFPELGVSDGVMFERSVSNFVAGIGFRCPKRITVECQKHEVVRAQQYVAIYERMYRNKFNITFPRDTKLLEFGVGPGEIAEEFKSHGLEVYGTDVVPRADGENVVAANNLPFGNNMFDMVSTTSVFHHIPREKHNQYLSEIKRILKSKGVIFMNEDEKGRNFVEQGVIRTVDRLVSGPEANSHRTDRGWRKYFDKGGIEVIASDKITHELGPIRLNKLFYLLEIQG